MGWDQRRCELYPNSEGCFGVTVLERNPRFQFGSLAGGYVFLSDGEVGTQSDVFGKPQAYQGVMMGSSAGELEYAGAQNALIKQYLTAASQATTLAAQQAAVNQAITEAAGTPWVTNPTPTQVAQALAQQTAEVLQIMWNAVSGSTNPPTPIYTPASAIPQLEQNLQNFIGSVPTPSPQVPAQSAATVTAPSIAVVPTPIPVATSPATPVVSPAAPAMTTPATSTASTTPGAAPVFSGTPGLYYVTDSSGNQTAVTSTGTPLSPAQVQALINAANYTATIPTVSGAVATLSTASGPVPTGTPGLYTETDASGNTIYTDANGNPLTAAQVQTLELGGTTTATTSSVGTYVTILAGLAAIYEVFLKKEKKAA